LGLPEHVTTILTGAEYRTVGSLLMAMKADRDSVLGLPGIGPKSMQAIEGALAKLTPEPAPEAVAEPTAEAAPVEAVAEPVTEVVTEVPAEAAPAEVVAEPVVQEEEKPAEEEEEKDFEKMFSLQNVVAVPPAAGEEDESSPKKKEKKQRKDRAYERDETRDQVVAVKKHKRGGDDVGGEDW
jgi:hypothetical protein